MLGRTRVFTRISLYIQKYLNTCVRSCVSLDARIQVYTYSDVPERTLCRLESMDPLNSVPHPFSLPEPPPLSTLWG